DPIEDKAYVWAIPNPLAVGLVGKNLAEFAGAIPREEHAPVGFDRWLRRESAGIARDGIGWAFRGAALLMLLAMPFARRLTRTPEEVRAIAMRAMAAARAAAAAAAAGGGEPALAGAGATVAPPSGAGPPGAPPPAPGTSPKIGALPGTGSTSVAARIAELEDALRELREQVGDDGVGGGGNGGGERPARARGRPAADAPRLRRSGLARRVRAQRVEVGRVAVRVEGPESAEQPMLRPVVVGRAGLQQSELVAALGEQLCLLGVVGDVEALDAVEPVLAEQVDRLQHLGVGVEVPVGVGPDRDAAGVVDPLDRLDHGRVRAREVGGLAGDQEVGQERGDVVVALGRESVGVRRVVEHGLREVGAADRLAGRAALGEQRVVDLPAELSQLRPSARRAARGRRARPAAAPRAPDR